MKLMVLDGNSIVNRAFYGVHLLSTKDGLYTNAIFGFLNILQKLISEEKPQALCVTFDLKAPTFRHTEYEGYKAQRKKMPDELAMQIPLLKDVLSAMNIPIYQIEGYEADDVIGTIAATCDRLGHDCLVVTGDKDSFQLITDKTHIRHVKTRMGQTETTEYDSDTFFGEYGFEPPFMVDLKALMGDSSDNIPGVSGIGEKTALELIRKFGSLQGVYENIDSPKIKASVRKKLSEGKEQADMSYHLATIIRDVPIRFNPEDNAVKPYDNDRLFELFKRLEFTKLTEKFGLTPPGESIAVEKTEYVPYERVNIITNTDFESLRGDAKKADIVFLSFDSTMSYFAVAVNKKIYCVCRDDREQFDKVISLIFDGSMKKGGHDVKAKLKTLTEAGIDCGGFAFDSSIAAYLIDPTDNSYELIKLLPKYCGRELNIAGSDENGQISFLAEVDCFEELIPECEAVSNLYEAMMPKIREMGLIKLMDEIEIPLCYVLSDMEEEGILIDRKALSDYSELLSGRIDTLEKEIYELAGEKFNINSPKQLGVVLFEKLMLPAPKKTKTGYSTNVDVLEKLKNKHPIINKIMDYRQLAKLKSTYTDGLMKFIGQDGRIHTTFQQTVTATGRLSSTDPNLQNIPVRSELGEEIRKMFIADEGKVLVDADYSQIELRLLAHISGDETMRDTFVGGGDIHAATAAQVFNVPRDEVTPKIRSSAKAVNFGIVYGISQYSLSQDIGVSVKEAKEYIDRYLENYRGVREYMGEIVKKAVEEGYVSTLYGRRRAIPELKSSNFNIRSFGERVALNMPIQGTAADIMKLAMIRVHNALRSELPKAKLLLQIHDELIVECPENEAEQCRDIICREMQNAASLSVPLTADGGIGKSWYEAK